MRPRSWLSWIAALGALTSSAFAGPVYKAKDIVAHFAPPPGLGESRALCIGTESECAKSVSAPLKTTPKGFDLVVNFEYNSDTLTKPARVNLDEFAAALKDPSLTSSAFVVEGHTDGTGGDDFNLELSVRRANAVVKYLEERGVPPARLESKGYGKQRLLVANPLSSANRRVETRLRSE